MELRHPQIKLRIQCCTLDSTPQLLPLPDKTGTAVPQNAVYKITSGFFLQFGLTCGQFMYQLIAEAYVRVRVHLI